MQGPMQQQEYSVKTFHERKTFTCILKAGYNINMRLVRAVVYISLPGCKGDTYRTFRNF